MNLVHKYLTELAKLNPSKTAVVCRGNRYSYQELDQQSTAFALSLASMGVCEGQRVAIILGNSVEAIISMYGILKAGATFVVINPGTKPAKIGYILNDCQCSILVTYPSKIAIVDQAICELPYIFKVILTGNVSYDVKTKDVNIIQYGDMVGYEVQSTNLPYVDDEVIAGLIYTSGSTGTPKGVVSPHRAMIAAASSITEYLKNTSDDIVLNVLPLSFDYGLYQVIMTFMYGGTIVLEDGFTFPQQVLETLVKENVTGFPIMPTITALLFKIPNYAQYMSQLRYISNTGGILPIEHIQAFRTALPDMKIYSMYGLTECKRVSYLDPDLIDAKPRSVGKPMSCCCVKVVDPNFNEVPSNTVGELVVYGDNLMDGYWQDPEKTQSTYKTIDGTRYLFSGDYFKMDEDGDLYYVSRKDDLIKVSGHRVSPREVEDVLHSLPGVVHAVVKPIPDKMLGNVLNAHVVVSNGLTEAQIRKHCHTYLEVYMMPATIKFWDAFPLSENGKIDRKNIS